MDWYYAEGNKQVGPLDGRQMGLLAQQGKITPTTLVWREGLQSWVAAQKVAPHLFQGAAPRAQPQYAGQQPAAQSPGASSGSSLNLDLTSDLGLKSNLADSLSDMSGTSDLLGDLGDLSGLSGLGVLGETTGAEASPVVGQEFVCAACGIMKPSADAVTLDGKVLCMQCGGNLGKDGGPAYTDGNEFYKEKAKRHPIKDFMAFWGRNSRQFMFAGVALGLVALLVLLRLSGAFGIARYLQYGVAAVIVATAYAGNGLERPYGRSIFIGTVLALVGELFLYRGSPLFLIAALAYLAAHAAFLIGFWIRGFSLGWSIGAAIPVLGISAATFAWLHQDASVEMEIAMVGFGLVLTAMTVFGVATIGAGASVTILLGAVAFYISEILFGYVLVHDYRGGLSNTLGVLPLRHIALILFAFSISTERERVGAEEARLISGQQPSSGDPFAAP